MKKIILLLMIIFLSVVGVYASTSQRIITLNPHQTVYVDPYTITNTTDKKIMAPYTDVFGKIGGNKFDNLSGRMFSGFGFGSRLSSTVDYGNFKVSNTNYNISYGSWSSCSRSCGGGVKTQYVSCKREDGRSLPSSYCGLGSSIRSVSCNTNPCPRRTTKKHIIYWYGQSATTIYYQIYNCTHSWGGNGTKRYGLELRCVNR